MKMHTTDTLHTQTLYSVEYWFTSKHFQCLHFQVRDMFYGKIIWNNQQIFLGEQSCQMVQIYHNFKDRHRLGQNQPLKSAEDKHNGILTTNQRKSHMKLKKNQDQTFWFKLGKPLNTYIVIFVSVWMQLPCYVTVTFMT